MTAPTPAPPAIARCRTTHQPAFGIRVEGTIDRDNAAAIAADLVERLRGCHEPTLVDLSEAVFADCTGVRLVRGALQTLDGVGVPLEIWTSDPVARVSFDLRRVA
jgi:anti-anti-sigma regulatory factor